MRAGSISPGTGTGLHRAPEWCSPYKHLPGAETVGGDGEARSLKRGSRPLRVAAFTAGIASPSARFRVRQYISRLADHEIVVNERWPKSGAFPPRTQALRPAWLIATLVQRVPHLISAWDADVVVLQREMVSTLPTLEGFTRCPRLVDIDDAIHLYRRGWAARRLAGLADLVVVGNSWLAEIWQQWGGAVEVLPTPVDTERYVVTPFPERPTIGWIGSSGNLPYLENIAPALSTVIRRFPGSTIAVCCDRKPTFFDVPIHYVPWSEESEAAFLSSISVGVMPLSDGPWERGKCSFKMLQYMAAGRPCVVSPVGMNRELLSQAELGLPARTNDEWVNALSELIADPDLRELMGCAGRCVAARFSVNALAPRFAELLHSLA